MCGVSIPVDKANPQPPPPSPGVCQPCHGNSACIYWDSYPPCWKALKKREREKEEEEKEKQGEKKKKRKKEKKAAVWKYER